MKCSEYEILISAYADGELHGPRKDEVENHIRRCGNCRDFYDETVRLQREMAEAFVECPEVPDIVSLVDARIRYRPKLRLTWAWAPAAALVLLAVWIFTLLVNPAREVKPMQRAIAPRPVPKRIQEKRVVIRTTPAEPLKENRDPAVAARVPHTQVARNFVPAPSSRTSPAKTTAAGNAGAQPPVTADEAEVVVEYSDAAPAAERIADVPVPSPAQVPTAGPGQRVVAQRESVTVNGRKVERVCYRIVDEGNGSESDERR